MEQPYQRTVKLVAQARILKLDKEVRELKEALLAHQDRTIQLRTRVWILEEDKEKLYNKRAMEIEDLHAQVRRLKQMNGWKDDLLEDNKQVEQKQRQIVEAGQAENVRLRLMRDKWMKKWRELNAETPRTVDAEVHKPSFVCKLQFSTPMSRLCEIDWSPRRISDLCWSGSWRD